MVLLIVAYALFTSLPPSRHVTTELDLGPVETSPAPELRHPAPNAAFSDVEDQPVQLSDLKGKTVIIRFWAPWCVVCRRESKPFAEMARRLPDSTVAVVVAVDYNSPKEVIEILGKPENYRLWFDRSDEAMQTWGIDTLPSSFLLDASGIVRGKRIGGTDWLGEDLQADLKKLNKFSELW